MSVGESSGMASRSTPMIVAYTHAQAELFF
jgi:hypothetical protein